MIALGYALNALFGIFTSGPSAPTTVLSTSVPPTTMIPTTPVPPTSVPLATIAPTAALPPTFAVAPPLKSQNYFENFRVTSDTPGELQFSVDYNYNGESGDIFYSAGCLSKGIQASCVEIDSSNFYPHHGPSSGALTFRIGLYGPSSVTSDQIDVGMYTWGPSNRIAYQVFDYAKQWTVLLATPTLVH